MPGHFDSAYAVSCSSRGSDASHYYYQGDFTQAAAWYRQALASNADAQPALLNLGKALLMQGNLAGSLDCFLLAHRFRDYSPEASLYAGMLLSTCADPSLRLKFGWNGNVANAPGPLGT